MVATGGFMRLNIVGKIVNELEIINLATSSLICMTFPFLKKELWT